MLSLFKKDNFSCIKKISTIELNNFVKSTGD